MFAQVSVIVEYTPRTLNCSLINTSILFTRYKAYQFTSWYLQKSICPTQSSSITKFFHSRRTKCSRSSIMSPHSAISHFRETLNKTSSNMVPAFCCYKMKYFMVLRNLAKRDFYLYNRDSICVSEKIWILVKFTSLIDDTETNNGWKWTNLVSA